VYHGIARRELESARQVAEHAGVAEHRFVRLPDLREAGDISGYKFKGLPPTYIPLRNGIFYTFAGSFAEEVGAVAIVGGHNRDDEKVFSDVSQSFFGTLQKALWAGSPILRKNRTSILRPLRSKTKVQVVRLASSIRVPLELTWSCHRDGDAHCWNCDGCLLRARSFAEARVKDPLSSQ
jgi:7-cyano-7-deazaguanine synthase